MKALRFLNDELALQSGPLPPVAEGEARIRVQLAGICATDLEILKGYMEFTGTLGHEFVGVVEECESLPEMVGKRIVGEINAGCGYCDYCRSGLDRHCPERTVLGIQGRDGAFEEFLSLPATNLHVVPDKVDNRAAVFTEPLAAAFEIVEQVHLKPGSTVLVIGDGRLAQLIVRVLSRVGCRVEVIGMSEKKLRLMKGYIAKAYLGSPPPGTKYPTVVDASGSPKGWETAISAVQPRGTIVLKSTYEESVDFNPSPLVIDEVTLVGSRCGPIAPALSALTDGLDPTQLIDGEFELKEWEEAFALARNQESLKVLFKIE